MRPYVVFLRQGIHYVPSSRYGVVVAGTVVVPFEAVVEFFAYVFVGLDSVITLSASGNGESRETQSGHEPQQHYDNQAAHGQGLRCLHCKYNNNVHTRKENRQESDGWGRKSYDAACCPPLWSNGSGRQVCGGRSGQGYNPYSSKKPRCTNCNGKGTIRCGICYGLCTRTCGRCNGTGRAR